jgi:hypothetical protein
MATPGPGNRSEWAEWLERLAHHIPGVGRYQDREGLRETDKQVRMHLAGQIADLVRIVERAQRRLTEATYLDPLPALDRVTRLVNTLADRIRFASYGFTGVFDLHKVRERELAALHRFDLELTEGVPSLEEHIRALADAATDEATFRQKLRAAEAALEEFGEVLGQRDRLARGL